MRVLIADGDPALALALPPRLRREGHQVTLRASPGGLVDAALAAGAHLVVLDPALVPSGDTAGLCRSLRDQTAALLLLVGRPLGIAERVRLLEAGADDYLPKPVQADELLARIRALLRRHRLYVAGQGGGLVRVTDALWLDLAGHRPLPYGGAADQAGAAGEVGLTDREFRLLAFLVRHECAVLTREVLL